MMFFCITHLTSRANYDGNAGTARVFLSIARFPVFRNPLSVRNPQKTGLNRKKPKNFVSPAMQGLETAQKFRTVSLTKEEGRTVFRRLPIFFAASLAFGQLAAQRFLTVKRARTQKPSIICIFIPRFVADFRTVAFLSLSGGEYRFKSFVLKCSLSVIKMFVTVALASAGEKEINISHFPIDSQDRT